MRLTWQSKIDSGSTVCPVDQRSQSQNCRLAFRLALRKSSRKPLSSVNALSLLRSLKSRIQASPMASVMSPESSGLHNCSQRRGVTPFVLLLKRSGKISEVLERGLTQQLGVNL